MEILETVAEAIVVSFVVGAVMGGVVVAHFQIKTQNQEDENLQPETIKINDRK
ncbi:MAG: hypothetical protein OEM38_08435 [Gammaproteobacteria bacterium]|nr:hypothetical protein [Gammaproteobacteria bacterium]